MDARELLRRYLEQRRDLGERELVLDSMSVEEALALLGARGDAAPPAEPSRGAVREQRPSAPSGRDREIGSDWRAALRDAGAEPEPERSPSAKAPRDAVARSGPPRADAAPAADAVHVPTTQPAETTDAELAGFPMGLVVGGASRALFGDPAAKLDTLDEIARAVAECRRCPLYATAKNPVPGVGNPDADFMCVGEAPGANEDEQGKPFVGQAGQLLTKILAAIDLERDDVFIANVLKHRPPGNRNPMPDEVTACSPYLVRQIELVRPKVILALGTFASQTLLETKLTIGKLRGQVHRYYGVPLIVTYHPAALLRNPSWKRPTWEDVQLARRVLDRARPAGA
ncbi:MAG TPA: uracil-DNA glycosylase [Gemmatimonadaceae bacterium]|nr:uracil-DNA glycosylase [Gemmatimonadaceae bacterium]